MSSGQPRPQAEMLDLALEVIRLVAPYCARIAIAGSLRRGKAMVGDIELVVRPDFQALPTVNKFLEIRQNAFNWICDQLRAEGVFEPRLNLSGHPEAWADRHKRAWYKGVKLDFFSVLPDRSWGYTLLIRTGPGEANQVLVTKEGQRNINGHLGILPEGYQCRDGELWIGETLVETPSEADVFAALRMPYIPPPLRTVENYQLWARRHRHQYEHDKRAWANDRECEGAVGNAWVGYPPQSGDVWLAGADGRVERQPVLLRLQKVGISQSELAS